MWELADLNIILGSGMGFMIASTCDDAVARVQASRDRGAAPLPPPRRSDEEVARLRRTGTVLVAVGVFILLTGQLSIAAVQQSIKGTTVVGGGILGGSPPAWSASPVRSS